MSSTDRIVKIDYTGPLWRGEEVHPELSALLAARDHLLVLQHGRPPYQVTLGVPHQAAAGVGKICELRRDLKGDFWPRNADENAAYYALGAFSTLCDLGAACRLVIMAHPSGEDPNKHLDSSYCQEIFGVSTRLLFECHGCRSDRQYDLELSAGKNPLAETLQFGRRLAAELSYRYPLAVQKEVRRSLAWIINGPGDEREGRLQMPANQTSSLAEAWRLGIPALHLEAKPKFRTPRNRASALTPAGRHLAQALAHTIVRQASL